jgi:RNA 2',3'-cyclic 3'-phosphodiesterase
MRAFVAIEVPEEIQNQIERMQAYFRRQLAAHPEDHAAIRWAPRGGIHLTMKFLGEVSTKQLDGMISSLKECAGVEKFVLDVRGFGFFPSARHPQVFWAGITGPAALDSLNRRIDAAMAQLGYPPENRRFTPHLTLARFKQPRPQRVLEALSAQQHGQSLGSFEVCQFCLFESRLKSGAPAEHVKLACFPP